MTKPSFFTIFISKNLWLEVGKWLFGHLPERVQSTAWCQKLRIDQTKILTPRNALYSLRKVLKLAFPQNKKNRKNEENGPKLWNRIKLDSVDQIKLMIPIFHTEFDPLQVLLIDFWYIPPIGGFGDF